MKYAFVGLFATLIGITSISILWYINACLGQKRLNITKFNHNTNDLNDSNTYLLEFMRKDLDRDKEVHSFEVKNAKDSIARKPLIKKPVNKVHVAQNDARVNNVPAKNNFGQLNKINKFPINKHPIQKQDTKSLAASKPIKKDVLKSQLTSNKVGRSEDDTPLKNALKVSKNKVPFFDPAVKNQDPLMEALNNEIGTETPLLPRFQDKALQRPRMTKATEKSTLKPASTSSSAEDIPELVHIGTIEKKKPGVVIPAPWKPLPPHENKISFLNNNEKSSNMVGEFSPPSQKMDGFGIAAGDNGGEAEDNLRPLSIHATKQDQAAIKDHSLASMNEASSSNQRETILEETSRNGNSSQYCLPKKNLFFLKSHKTGGSTVQNIILRYGLKHNLHFAMPINKHDYFYPRIFKRDFIQQQLEPPYNLMAFHIRFNYEEVRAVMPEDTNYVAIIREPFSHFESSFHFFYNIVPSFQEFPWIFAVWKSG